MRKLQRHTVTMADPREEILVQLPPSKRLWRPVEWHPFYINALLFGAMEEETDIKKYSTKHCFTLR